MSKEVFILVDKFFKLKHLKSLLMYNSPLKFGHLGAYFVDIKTNKNSFLILLCFFLAMGS